MSRTFALLKIGVLLGVLAMAAACGGSDDGDATGGETGSGEYGLRGQVLETTTNTPIAGLEVAIGSEALGWKAATTDAMGWWQVDGYDADSTRIWLKGRDLKSGAKRYPSVKTAIHDDWKQLDQLVTIPAQKYLPVVDAATSVDVSGNLVESTDAGPTMLSRPIFFSSAFAPSRGARARLTFFLSCGGGAFAARSSCTCPSPILHFLFVFLSRPRRISSSRAYS